MNRLKVLVVDDEPDIRLELQDFVEELDFQCVLAANGEEALLAFKQDDSIQIVLSDLTMPGMSGLELLERITKDTDTRYRTRRFIFMTGNGDTRAVIDAMRLGASEFMLKPMDLDLLEDTLVEAREYVTAERFRVLNEQAREAELAATQVEVSGLNRDIRKAYSEALACLARAAEYKDPETGAHINRIGAYAALLAAELGWSREQCEMIRLVAPLHDVGKVATPDAVLLKKGPLTDEEFATMRQHPKFGYEVLSVSDYPVMAMAARIALNHHERWDGGGYPRGLNGSEIPMEASITTLVDVYDALRSVRPYKPSMTHEEAMTIILEGDGRTSPTHFRPEVLEAFKGADQAMNHIFESMAD
ncbi:response regulator [Luminiphilus sp.]|nr:response regulator [Luminiphilus sp.]